MAAQSNIPAVNAKNLAIVNDVRDDVKKLNLEDAELVKTIALNPAHVGVAALNARRAAIANSLKSHE